MGDFPGATKDLWRNWLKPEFSYRPRQPNWHTQCEKFTQILREINFGQFKAPKTAILTISAALNFEFLETFDMPSVKFLQKSKF